MMLPQIESIYDRIFEALRISDLMRLSWTCKTVNTAVEAYYTRRFQIHDVLKRYMTESETSYLRYLQSRTGMLISGSTALQFLDRDTYPDSDLDLYVEHRYASFIGHWLMDIGYTFKPRTSLPPDTEFTAALSEVTQGLFRENLTFFQSESGYFGRGIANVLSFHKSNPERKVQIITTYHSPLESILNFHSTCVMNIITHEKAYCLYAKATLHERRSLCYNDRLGTDKETARAKYVQRGFTMVDKATQDEIQDPTAAFGDGFRYVGDSKCWAVTIQPRMHHLPPSYVETNSWSLIYPRDPNISVDMSIINFGSNSYKFCYTLGNASTQIFVRDAYIEEEDELKNGLLDAPLNNLIKQCFDTLASQSYCTIATLSS